MGGDFGASPFLGSSRASKDARPRQGRYAKFWSVSVVLNVRSASNQAVTVEQALR
jgi:hypothetical protein